MICLKRMIDSTNITKQMQLKLADTNIQFDTFLQLLVIKTEWTREMKCYLFYLHISTHDKS